VETRDEVGRLVVMFTDGVSEAQNTQGGFFEIDRIVETVRRHRHEDAAAVTERLLEAVRAFAGEAPSPTTLR
jgi:sigma-B regulation protein RsbU (phosphoserine phosphatase)